jgi:hypothetical protein
MDFRMSLLRRDSGLGGGLGSAYFPTCWLAWVPGAVPLVSWCSSLLWSWRWGQECDDLAWSCKDILISLAWGNGGGGGQITQRERKGKVCLKLFKAFLSESRRVSKVSYWVRPQLCACLPFCHGGSGRLRVWQGFHRDRGWQEAQRESHRNPGDIRSHYFLVHFTDGRRKLKPSGVPWLRVSSLLWARSQEGLNLNEGWEGPVSVLNPQKLWSPAPSPVLCPFQTKVTQASNVFILFVLPSTSVLQL